jgi:hypothetical protein
MSRGRDGSVVTFAQPEQFRGEKCFDITIPKTLTAAKNGLGTSQKLFT